MQLYNCRDVTEEHVVNDIYNGKLELEENNTLLEEENI